MSPVLEEVGVLSIILSLINKAVALLSVQRLVRVGGPTQKGANFCEQLLAKEVSWTFLNPITEGALFLGHSFTGYSDGCLSNETGQVLFSLFIHDYFIAFRKS